MLTVSSICRFAGKQEQQQVVQSQHKDDHTLTRSKQIQFLSRRPHRYPSVLLFLLSVHVWQLERIGVFSELSLGQGCRHYVSLIVTLASLIKGDIYRPCAHSKQLTQQTMTCGQELTE